MWFQRPRKTPASPRNCIMQSHGCYFRLSRFTDPGYFIPASVTHLSFVSYGTDEEAKALAITFHDLPAVMAQAPSLKEIHLTLPAEAIELYRDHFARVSRRSKRRAWYSRRNSGFNQLLVTMRRTNHTKDPDRILKYALGRAGKEAWPALFPTIYGDIWWGEWKLTDGSNHGKDTTANKTDSQSLNLKFI